MSTGGAKQFPPVKLFTLGENVWREEEEWPLARTRYTPFFLRSRNERHVLSVEPGATDQATYRYDPADPVPTRGGAMLSGRRRRG